MVRLRESRAFHSNSDDQGQTLTAADRERLLQPYLPAAPSSQTGNRTNKTSKRKPSSSSSSASSSSNFHHKQRLRPALRHLLHTLLFTLLHAAFSVYIRLRKACNALTDRFLAVRYYHHRTPEIIKRDVKGLSKLPRHLSVILQLPPDEGADKDRLEMLFDDACEVVAWTASAGVPMLSIYERTGALKHSLPHLHRRISRTLTSYFGASSPAKPTFSLRAPHLPSYSPPLHSPSDPATTNEPAIPNNPDGPSSEDTSPPHLTILLLDSLDGRQTLVDLTKTLAEMSQHDKLSPSDISSELIDAEISESVMPVEPDLLMTFGERMVLEGYPPWQARLTEIFALRDNLAGVGYQVFLRGLYKYARAEFRVGR